MYAIAQDLIQEHGINEIVQLLEDETELVTEANLVAALAGDFPIDEDERSDVEVAISRLDNVLQQSALFMNGYIASSNALPLTADVIAKNPLKSCNIALARCKLMDDADNTTEHSENVCKDWKKWLFDISKGTVKLIQANNKPTCSGARSGVMQSAYSWEGYP